MNVGGATPSCCGPMGGQFIELIDDIIIGRAKKNQFNNMELR